MRNGTVKEKSSNHQRVEKVIHNPFFFEYHNTQVMIAKHTYGIILEQGMNCERMHCFISCKHC